MTMPNLLLGLLISTLYGTLFHFWRGGNGSRLVLYIILSWIGFWLGNYSAGLLDLTFGSIGTLRLGLATIGSLITLGLGYWLSLVETSSN